VLSGVESLFFPFRQTPSPMTKPSCSRPSSASAMRPIESSRLPNAICKHCFAPVAYGADRCDECGRAERGSSRAQSIGWTVPVLLACASVWLLLNPRPPTPPRNPHYAAEVHAVEKGPALEVSKVFSLDYLDQGDKIELSINSPSNPVLYVDVNQDGLPDAGDLSYATDGQTPCVRRVATADDSGTCNETPSRATVCSQQSEGMNRVTWTIPKRDLQITGSGADIVIEIFDAVAQKGRYYPDNQLFRRVYHLILKPVASTGITHGAEAPSGARPPTPEPPRLSAKNPVKARPPASTAGTELQAPQIESFNSDVGSVAAGGAVRLSWSVIGNVSNVSLNLASTRCRSRTSAPWW
jgi:hypothetical protein